MKKKIKLKKGDTITVVSVKDENKELITYIFNSPKKANKEIKSITKNSLVASFIEYLGTKYTRKEKNEVIRRMPGDFPIMFRHMDILEINHKEKWYTIILNKIHSFLKRK